VRFAITTIESLYSTLIDTDAIVLLGAGASLKSGIPLSANLVERAAKWAYCRNFNRHPEDPTVVRSDWLPWLHEHPWYKINQSPSDNYSAVIEYLLQPRQNRKEFFLRLLRPGVPPSLGYERLVDLMAKQVIKTVLSTNFDEVLPDLCRTRSSPHYVEIIKTPADYTKFTTFPRYPQIIYLHGSVEHYNDKNLLDEVQRLDEELVRMLLPLLRDHPLVVIGYRGAEPSVMKHLLIEQAAAANRFRQGIFWCTRHNSIPNGLHPLVGELADTIGRNLQVVPIDGFDELLTQLWNLYEQRPLESVATPASNRRGTASTSPTFDMKPFVEATIDELDWSRVQSQIVAYCRELAISVPTPVDRNWLIKRLCELDLAVQQNEKLYPTIAGYLLFASHPETRVAAARVVLHVVDGLKITIGGNLWSQLEAIMNTLEEVNRPFRLKGTVSETVLPYPPLALKELVVNALVHRQYDITEGVEIWLETTHIRIKNPGGLVADVIRQVGLPLQERIERGGRGIKGYRNPVIADLFYGAGAMDKRGSGLADVQELVGKNGGKVIFGPIADNSAFEVTLFCRPETVDAVTGTAVSLISTGRYISNLLEVISLPTTVWHASTSARRVKEIWAATGASSLPPFTLYDRRIFCLANLADPTNPLASQIDLGSLEQLKLAEFANAEEGERRLVHLLNECLYRHLETCGLIVDKKRKRAYFSRLEGGGPRAVTYQARIRQATRTVTKPIVSKTTQKLLYWEHEAVYFKFEPYGETWALQILPGYVFTVNGWRKLVEGPRVAALATRRAAHDYNPQVHNDLVFWTWILGRGQDCFALNAGCDGRIELRGSLAFCEVRDLPQTYDEIEVDPRSIETDLDELQEELAELAELTEENFIEELEDSNDTTD
jgi:hypothetical protein